MKHSLLFALLLSMVTCNLCQAAEFVFDTPSDDRWQYPFNATPGQRTTASTFGAAAISGFNDRDGIVLAAWETADQIDPNLAPDQYRIESVRVVASNFASQFVIPAWEADASMDEWFHYDLSGDDQINADGLPRGDAGDTDGESFDSDPNIRPVELFGVGFGPAYTPASWNEGSPYVGASGTDQPRDPYPLTFKEFTGESLHVEDAVKGLHNDALGVGSFSAVPWALGRTVGYTPGQTQAPFDIVFNVDLDLSDGRVRNYFQQQLSQGKVFVAITSLLEAAQQGAQSGFPSIIMKEGLFLDPAAHAIRLEIDVTLDVPPTVCGDFGTTFLSMDTSGPQGVPDCYVNLFDFTALIGQWLGCTDPANAACL